MDHIQHSLEATLGVGLDHPRLVTTLACHSRLSRGMVGHVSGIDRPIGDHEPCVLESWILLEYCEKGSLLVTFFLSSEAAEFTTQVPAKQIVELEMLHMPQLEAESSYCAKDCDCSRLQLQQWHVNCK